MTQLNVTTLRSQLREVLARVAKGESIDITQDGRVVAVLMHPSQANMHRRTPALEAAAQLQARLQAKRAAFVSGERRPLGTLSPEFAQELLDDIRWHRDR